MQLHDHTEYQPVYLRNQRAFGRCQTALEAWRAVGTPLIVEAYDLAWTPTSIRQFVQELAALFQAYNQVLWQQFSYCGTCGGQCCVVDASDIRPFDLLAIALLDETAPLLPERIATVSHACVYLNGQQCTWPAGWRTIKCWSFYCLGGGPWPTTTPLSELYQAITVELQGVVNEKLPIPLRRYQTIHNVTLSDQLDDPVAFANGLHGALDSLFVMNFDQHYPCLDLLAGPTQRRSASPASPVNQHIFNLQYYDDAEGESGLEIIAALSEALLQVEGSEMAERLADLETLVWVIESQPAQARTLIEKMHQRYTQLPEPKDSAIAHLWQHLWVYLQRFPLPGTR